MVEGTVATLQPYGAFVNLGENMNGLLHISQISHDRISSVEQVLKIGQKVKVSWNQSDCYFVLSSFSLPLTSLGHHPSQSPTL